MNEYVGRSRGGRQQSVLRVTLKRCLASGVPRFHVVAAVMIFVGLLTPSAWSQETAEQAIQRAAAAHGRKPQNTMRDTTAIGTITLFNTDGPTFTSDVALMRGGNSMVQRVIKVQSGELRQGSDGVTSWDNFAGFLKPALGRALQFIESQTVRSTDSLFDYQALGLTLQYLGQLKGTAGIQATDSAGRTTRYYIDASSRIIKIEAITGAGKSAVGGALMLTTDAYMFSDYRMVDGMLAPFHIERLINGLKVEEMQFTSVTSNVAIPRSTFTPNP